MLVRLGIDDARDKTFDCGENDLNEFFFEDSREACRSLIAVTYAWMLEGRTVAFFSVSNDALKKEKEETDWFNRIVRKIPNRKRYKSQPAVKIGRLAVNKPDQGSGIGTTVIDFIKGWFVYGNKTGCRFLIVDALNKPKVLSFYEKNGFSFLRTKDEAERTRLMYFDLSTISLPES